MRRATISLRVLNGSEGNLGVITSATLRLLPRPEATETLLAAFDSVKAGAEAVSAIIGAGVIPAAIEMMDRVVIDACERYMALGLPKAEALLLVEVDGGAEETAEMLAAVQELLAGCGATEVRVARGAEERANLWKSRKGAFAALATVCPDYYTMDGTIPRRALPEVLESIYALGREYGMVIGNVFHAGDGNMHPCIFYDSAKAGELERSEELGGKILELCIEHGGTITGEHGVGLEKLKADVPAVPRRRDRRLPRRQGCLRSRGHPQSGQGRSHPQALRRVGRHARARRPPAAPRNPPLLIACPSHGRQLHHRIWLRA